MKLSFRALTQSLIIITGTCLALAGSAFAAPKTSFKVGYTIYVGFMPMGYLKDSGILKKWADKYGIEIEMMAVNDYVGSINQFIAGDLDAVGVAGMDALTMPAAGGVDTSIFLITDYSNGNDVLMSKSASSIAELKDKEVYLVEYSVSHYLLNRALVLNGMSGVGEVKTVNISDADIAAAYLANPDIQNAAAWKPMTADMISGSPDTKVLFDSAQIPGEIMDVFIGNTEVLKENPAFGKALTGAWYEALAAIKAGGEAAKPVNEYMASALGTDQAGLKTQIDTTFFFYTPAEAVTFLTDAKTGTIMDDIRKFSFDRGLFGQGATSVDAIGIELADGTVLGDPANVKLRVDASYAKLGAEGGL
jgi:NitT/TauT family transport system substrate-binding protein